MEKAKAWLVQTDAFLQEKFRASAYFQTNPAEAAYRLEHSYRVANIGRLIAEKEGFDITEMTIACLLHDISYCDAFQDAADRRNHGRYSAQIARPFLLSLGIPEDRVNDICYGIAIHVDDRADFPGERTAFAETISDADNIDRFDVYRIHENLNYMQFQNLLLEEKQQKVTATLERLYGYQAMPLATETASELWKNRLAFYIAFYERLREQLANSKAYWD